MSARVFSGTLFAVLSLDMKTAVLIFLIFVTSVAQADPGKRRTKEERKRDRVEQQYARKSHVLDERSPDQKKKDRHHLFALLIGVSLIVSAMNRGE